MTGGLQRCVVCVRDYEPEDMAGCPAYGGLICSLCCTLDARCGDRCKPQPRLVDQLWARWRALLGRLLPRRFAAQVDTGLGQYLLLMLFIVPALGGLIGLLYHQEMRTLAAQAARTLAGAGPTVVEQIEPALRGGFIKAYAALLLVAGIVAWWLVLAHKSRQVAQEESTRQTEALMREIDSHRQTDLQLQEAKRLAEAANQAKTRYITAISHELRTPLNSILGYAQLLEEDDAMPAHRRQAVSVIRRGGDHLLSLIEGTLDVARIEGGKLTLDVKPMRFRDSMAEIARLFELQAEAKGIRFVTDFGNTLPEVVRADERRLRQILINLLGNAVKFTSHGQVSFRLHHTREMARISIVDSGPGMTAAELERVFEPFVRGSAAGTAAAGGTGLGLTISKMLTDLMGGEMTVSSTPGEGSTFSLRLFLPEVHAGLPGAAAALPRPLRTGYRGPRRRILVVDNEEADRMLLADLLQPLGFVIDTAASGEEGLARLANGLRPDAIFMDLAMPGIDGWETIRRLRAQGLSNAPLAIVSANAFDQGLDNDVGLPPRDFLVKPVRLPDLLDWLGGQLALDWVQSAPPGSAPAPQASTPLHYPDPPTLKALQELVGLGYLRGIHRKLDEIEAADAAAARFVAALRTLAGGFQLDAMNGLLKKALDEHGGP